MSYTEVAMGPYTTLLDGGEANEQSHMTGLIDIQKEFCCLEKQNWPFIASKLLCLCDKECSCNIYIH